MFNPSTFAEYLDAHYFTKYTRKVKHYFKKQSFTFYLIKARSMDGRQHFINYLLSHFPELSSEVYTEVVSFIKSPKGLIAFEKFKNSKMLGDFKNPIVHISKPLDKGLNKLRKSYDFY